MRPGREIRAAYDDEGLYVYQAYRPEIGLYAAEHGRFGPGFKLDRMTWIKPSFGWMLYRCGYGFKPDQEVEVCVVVEVDDMDCAADRKVAVESETSRPFAE